VGVFNQGMEVMKKFDRRLFTKEEYLTEAQRLLSLLRHSSGVTGSERRQLSQRERDISAHSLNALGICTKDIKLSMIPVGQDGRYAWEPATDPPRAVPQPAGPLATDWEEIHEHVRIFGGPRGRLCIRNKAGRIIKMGRTADELYQHVYWHILNWRAVVAL